MSNFFLIREGLHDVIGDVVSPKENEDAFSLARRMIGCDWIEPVYRFGESFPGLVLLVDEEGVLQDRVSNPVATAGAGTWIVGNAIVARVGKDDFEPLTARDIDDLREFVSFAAMFAESLKEPV